MESGARHECESCKQTSHQIERRIHTKIYFALGLVVVMMCLFIVTQDGYKIETKDAPAGAFKARIVVTKEVDPATIKMSNAHIWLEPAAAGAGQTASLRFFELAANGTNSIGFKSADNLSVDTTWTLPAADGAANQALLTNGSGVLSWGSPSSVSTFTSSGTFVVPTGVTRIYVTMVGGGGGGGGGAENTSGGGTAGGGGGGASGSALQGLALTVSGGESITVTIGAAGSGGAGGAAFGTAGTNGAAGGDTSLSGTFGTVTAKGGGGGVGAPTGTGGVGGLPTGTDDALGDRGRGGGNGAVGNGGNGAGGLLGGGGTFGPAGTGSNGPGGNGAAGTHFGGGGGGGGGGAAAAGAGAGGNGGNGTAGIVVIRW